MTKGFTLLEILIVVVIIGMLTALSAIPYASYVKKSRDARRKVDIEQLRAALELYRSNNDAGVYPSDLSVLAPDYIKVIPTDPSSPTVPYAYTCVPVGTCTDYQLSAQLEAGTTSNYVVSAGGQVTTDNSTIPTATPTSPVGSQPTATLTPTKAPTPTPSRTPTPAPACVANGALLNGGTCCSNKPCANTCCSTSQTCQQPSNSAPFCQ